MLNYLDNNEEFPLATEEVVIDLIDNDPQHEFNNAMIYLNDTVKRIFEAIGMIQNG
jgi:hypothetical protein